MSQCELSFLWRVYNELCFFSRTRMGICGNCTIIIFLVWSPKVNLRQHFCQSPNPVEKVCGVASGSVSSACTWFLDGPLPRTSAYRERKTHPLKKNAKLPGASTAFDRIHWNHPLPWFTQLTTRCFSSSLKFSGVLVHVHNPEIPEKYPTDHKFTWMHTVCQHFHTFPMICLAVLVVFSK